MTVSFSQERLYDHVSIALVGKYTDLKDSYMSVIKALEHSAFRCQRKLTLHVRLPISCLKCYELRLAVGRIFRFRAGKSRCRSKKIP
jgi:hypothetical protein